MSFDLGVFYTELQQTDKSAAARYSALCNSDDIDAWIEPSPRVDTFLTELEKRFPTEDAFTDNGVYESPWSCEHDKSPGHVILSMAHARADEIAPVILDLVQKHGLVCFDPQSGKIAWAPPGIKVGKLKRRAKPGKIAKPGKAAWQKSADDLLASYLKGGGFSKKGSTWRKDETDYVFAVRSVRYDVGRGEVDGYGVECCAWAKALGDIEPNRVSPSYGAHHVSWRLAEHLPHRLAYQFAAALDCQEDSMGPANSEVTGRIQEYLAEGEANIQERRLELLETAIVDYLLPWFDLMRAYTFPIDGSEPPARFPLVRATLIGQFLSATEVFRERLAQPATLDNDDDLIAYLKDALILQSWVVVVLSALKSLPLTEAKQRVLQSGAWGGDWPARAEDTLQKILWYEDDVVEQSDGVVRIVLQ